MSLSALKDLFARHRNRATGLWRLGQEPQRTVFLESGDVVFAASTHPLDRLTHLLVERGKITQAQLDYAMANLNSTMSIGKNLIEMGFITQRDLLDVARAQVERVVWASLADGTAPVFDDRDLEPTTVRLPFDTPAMLLAGVLNLRDRERLLEELGPLNQVVVLEGRRHQQLTLPPDLARLPGLMDGSRTLLELSRESGVEPFRLGAFVLFLREMGWARLHELPPLDRRALELALEPPESGLTPPLPEPEPAPVPSLFAEIHASQHPTTNLEHLSEALDRLGPEDEVEPSPTPAPEVALPIQHEAEGSTEPVAPSLSGAPRRSRIPLLLLVGLLVGAGSWVGLRRYLGRPHASPGLPPPAPTVTAPEPPQTPEPRPAAEPVPESGSLAAPPVKPEPPPTPGPAVDPKPSGPASRSERLKVILAGDWKVALAQGAAQRKHLGGRWSLRLEIACQGTTVQRAAQLLKDMDPDLFVLPMAMRDGRTCYQVFLGDHPSEAAARKAAQRLPAPFLAEGNRPKPYRATQIPDSQ